MPTHDNSKVPSGGELADESLVMENKSLGGYSSADVVSPNREALQEDKVQQQQPKQYNQQTLSRSEVDQCRTMQWKIIRSIIESETVYLDCLNTLQQVSQ